MLTKQQKLEIWRRACEDFPDDEMMQELHVIGEILTALRSQGQARPWQKLGELARREYADLLKHLETTGASLD